MFLYPISDMHIDLNPKLFLEKNIEKTFGFLRDYRDVVICACGDIAERTLGIKYFEKLLELQPDLQIVYIPGNHEFYGSNIDEMYEDLHTLGALTHRNLHVLDGKYITHAIIGNCLFTGATLWTDYHNGSPIVMNEIQRLFNDYIRIYSGTPFKPITTNRIMQEHFIHKKNILRHLKKYKDVKYKIVMTHHQPYFPSCVVGADAFAFYTDMLTSLKELDTKELPDFWFSGHTHASTYLPQIINNKEVIFASNQLGYKSEYGVTGYNENCIFELT